MLVKGFLGRSVVFNKITNLDPWLYNSPRKPRALENPAFNEVPAFLNEDIYDRLKSNVEVQNFCSTDLHDCGQPTARQEEKCPDEQFNHCICPISKSYKRVSFKTFDKVLSMFLVSDYNIYTRLPAAINNHRLLLLALPVPNLHNIKAGYFF